MARNGSNSRGKGGAGPAKPVKSVAEKKRRVRDDDEEVASGDERHPVASAASQERDAGDEPDIESSEVTEKRFRRALTKLVDYLVRLSTAWEMEEKENVERAVRRTKKLEGVKKSLPDIEYRFLVIPFRRLLQKNLTSIKRGPRYDAWLREVPTKKSPDGVPVKLAFPAPGTSRKAQPSEIKLSTLYLDSLDLCDRVQMQLNSSKDTDELEEMYAHSEQLIYPDVIRLYLWTIFASIADDVAGEGTGQLIRQSLETLAMDLGVASGGDLLRRFMRVAVDDDGPFSTMLSIGGNMVKKMVPSIAPNIDEAVELVQEFANGEIGFNEVISKVVDMITDAFPSLNKREDGREVIGQFKETVASTLGGIARDGEKALNPMETIGKFTEVFKKLQQSKFMRAKFEELQSEVGNVKSLSDMKNIDPMSIIKIVTREVGNVEFVSEIERITGKSIEHSEAIALITKLNKIYETLAAILKEENVTNGGKKVLAITDGTAEEPSE